MENQKGSKTAGKAIRCKAAVCRNPGEPLVIEEIEVEPPKAWEIRIKILCTSLCHTDVTFWKMSIGPYALFPRIFGHEAVGVVESVGEHVEEVEEGDIVVPVFHPNCTECKDCKSLKGNGCSIFGNRFTIEMPRDSTSRFKGMNGETLHHFLCVSSFSEYTVVDMVHVVKIPRDFPVDKACLLSCGVSTGIGAAWKVADIEEGSTVAIFGLGAVGLAVAEGARLRGASKIIGVDLNDEKFEMGKKFGVTDFINPTTCGEKKVSEVITEITDGGADYSFECIGLASLMEDAFNSTRQVISLLGLKKNKKKLIFMFGLGKIDKGGGKTVILGVERHATPLAINTYLLLRGKTVTGCYFGGLKPKSDIPLLTQKYLNQELNLDGFITQEVSFKDINEAFDKLVEGKSLRCIIWMD